MLGSTTLKVFLHILLLLFFQNFGQFCEAAPFLSDVLLRFVPSVVPENGTSPENCTPSQPIRSSVSDGIEGMPVVIPTPINAAPGKLGGKSYSTGRTKLVQQLSRNPMLQQPNVDELPINVNIKLVPVKIQDLTERIEVLETTLRLQLTWVDRRLSWDPLSYSNLTEVVVSAHSIWAPDIAILNSVYDVYHVIRDMRFEMKIENGGRVWWHPTGIVRTYCKLSLRYYPFDKQRCYILFESPTLDIRFMNLTLRSKTHPVDTRMFTDSETWKVLEFSGKNAINQVGSRTFFTRVEFMLYIERANIFHLINFILPAVILSSVQVLFFLLPATHPQRVGSTTTILLSVIVFQTVVVSQLPKTSTDVPLLSIYMFCVTIVSGLSVSTSVFVAKFVVFAEKHKPMPKWLRKVPHPWYFFLRLIGSSRRRNDCNVRKNEDENKVYEIKNAHEKSTEFSAENLAPLAQIDSLFTLDPNNNVMKKSKSNNGSTLIVQQDVVCLQLTKTSESFESNYENVLKSRQILPKNGNEATSVTIQIIDDDKKGKGDDDSDEIFWQKYALFKTWNDIGICVDWFLMIIAALTASMSPLVLFVLMPWLAKYDEEITTTSTFNDSRSQNMQNN